MQRLSHERLEVYQKAVEFFAVAAKLLDSLPKGQRTLADQLRRASLSTLLNIAEVAGKPSPAEGRHHFAIARGSALECAAALDAIRLLGLAEDEPIERGKDLLVAVVSMLSKMCRVQAGVNGERAGSSRLEASRGSGGQASRSASPSDASPSATQ